MAQQESFLPHHIHGTESSTGAKFVPLAQQAGKTNFLNAFIVEECNLSIDPQHHPPPENLSSISTERLCYLRAGEHVTVFFKLIEPLTVNQCLLVGFELECTNPEQRQELAKWTQSNSNKRPIELLNNSVLAQTVTYNANTRKFEFPWIYSMGDMKCLSFQLNYHSQKSNYQMRFRVSTELYSYPTQSFTAEGALFCPVYVYKEENLQAGSPSPSGEQQSLSQAIWVNARTGRQSKARNGYRGFPWAKVVPNNSVSIKSLGYHFFGPSGGFEYGQMAGWPITEIARAKDGWYLSKQIEQVGQDMCTLLLQQCINIPDDTNNELATFGSIPQSTAQIDTSAVASCSTASNSQLVGQTVEQSPSSTSVTKVAQRSPRHSKYFRALSTKVCVVQPYTEAIDTVQEENSNLQGEQTPQHHSRKRQRE